MTFPLFLRDGSASIVEPLSHIINTSIFMEQVPLGFKQARVLPLFKKGSKLDVGNYRPVSVLSVLSKLIQTAVHDQLSDYFQKRGLLYEYQSGIFTTLQLVYCKRSIFEMSMGWF